MKKIIGLVMMLFSMITLSSFTERTIIEVGIINDETSINNDLSMLGLTSSDYVILNDGIYDGTVNHYDQVYLIGVGENRHEKDVTDIYFYLYNPCDYSNDSFNVKLDYYLFDIKINNNNFDFIYVENPTNVSLYYDINPNEYNNLSLIDYSKDKNIWKLKYSYINHTNDRTYELGKIQRGMSYSEKDYPEYVNYLKDDFTNPFTATFREREEDGRLVTSYDYNSFIYITEDILVPVLIRSENNFENFWNGVFAGRDEALAENSLVYFYNFSSSKRIDQILELDVQYKTHGACLMLKDSLIDNTDDCNASNIDTTLNDVSRTLYPGLHSYDWFSSHLEFETFKTPASERFTNEEFGYLQFSNDQKRQFTDYEHSVLINMESPSNRHQQVVEEGFVDHAYTCYHNNVIEDLQVKRIMFETDGQIYNSYVADDVDDPIDPIVPETPKSFLESLIDWIKENPARAVAVIIAIVVGLPLVIAFLPYIIKFIINLIKTIIQVIIYILSLPFKLIKWIFTGGKKNE